MISTVGLTGGASPPPGFALYSALPRQYTDANFASVDPQSIYAGASPAVVSGDVGTAGLSVSPGSYATTLLASGILSVDLQGDSSRQTLPVDVYYSALKMWGAVQTAGYTAALANQPTFYLNNQAPVFPDTEPVLALPRNQAITPTSLNEYWTDAESDAITVTAIDSLAALGLSVDGSSDLTGTTPDANSVSTGRTMRGTDIAGDTADGDFTIIVGQVEVPDVEGQEQGSAETEILAGYLTFDYASSQYSLTVPLGEVISQSPAAGAFADPGSAVTLTVSLGEQVAGALPNSFYGSRRLRRYLGDRPS
jgi:hypothetical protein